ncbi:hypothetical protein ACE01N_20415 [Saccharicrinis sp. FJH2]|uniref:hypothetical protein n=1 Tax=Saccharicrinis sp. FJH65 TaxID=3344659 RepID=UPI0035F2CC5C
MKASNYILIMCFLTLTFKIGAKNKLKISQKFDPISQTSICTDFQIPHCIENAEAKLSEDTLIIEFYKVTASTFDDLKIKVINDRFMTSYKTVYIAAQNGKNIWIPKNECLKLNSNQFLEGKILKGTIDFDFQEIFIKPNGERIKTRIINFKGEFKTKINTAANTQS